MITPRRIEWSGPEGWTVWADEDGVHVRSVKGDSLEAPDLARLIDLVSEAKAQIATSVPAPAPEARDERLYRDRKYEAKRAARAVYDTLAPGMAGPF